MNYVRKSVALESTFLWRVICFQQELESPFEKRQIGIDGFATHFQDFIVHMEYGVDYTTSHLAYDEKLAWSWLNVLACLIYGMEFPLVLDLYFEFRIQLLLEFEHLL